MTEQQMVDEAIKQLFITAVTSFHVDRDANRLRQVVNRIRQTRKLVEGQL